VIHWTRGCCAQARSSLAAGEPENQTAHREKNKTVTTLDSGGALQLAMGGEKRTCAGLTSLTPSLEQRESPESASAAEK
jgi:hypothetical protein